MRFLKLKKDKITKIPAGEKVTGDVFRSMRANYLQLNTVRLNQTLSHFSEGQSENTHAVKKGDTLSKIAKEKGVSVDEIAKHNSIEDANKINLGQEIKLPKKEKTEEKEEKNNIEQSTNKDGKGNEKVIQKEEKKEEETDKNKDELKKENVEIKAEEKVEKEEKKEQSKVAKEVIDEAKKVDDLVD